MRRQILCFAILCAFWAVILRYAQSDFLSLWIELKAAGVVMNEDYYETWRRYLLPYVALFVLSVTPVIAGFSSHESKRSFHRRSGSHPLWSGVR